MKIFPHILARVAGVPFEELKKLRLSGLLTDEEGIESTEHFFALERKIAIEKGKIIDDFQTTFQDTKNYKLRNILLNASRDFFNNRNVNLQKWQNRAEFF